MHDYMYRMGSWWRISLGFFLLLCFPSALFSLFQEIDFFPESIGFFCYNHQLIS